LDVQINAIRTKFVKYKHKYRNQHAVLHKLYAWSLAETWSKVWGDEVGALSPKIFCRPLQNVKFRGGGSLSWWISIFKTWISCRPIYRPSGFRRY